MKYTKSIFLLVVFWVSCSLSAETLTKESVSDLLTKVEESVQARNPELLVSYFTDNVEVTMVMPKNMGGTLKANKQQYKEMLKQGWAMPGKYTYEVRDIKITVSKDSKSAVVTDLTVESIEIGGQKIESKSRERIEVVVQNGKPLIQKIYGKIEL